MKLHCTIRLPSSKSESNRALMIATYGGFLPDFQNLSESQDTKILRQALTKSRWPEAVINIADCGTAARFMTTLLASQNWNGLLTGSERMQQRPMEPLVLALRDLGAEIHYVGKEGFLPLHIRGKRLEGGKTALNITQSSQFASSLLLAAPMWPQGIDLELLGELNSLPYIDMTLAMMRHFGVEAQRYGRRIVVKPKPYQSRDFMVSSDWSAASYWYEVAALCEECEIRLEGYFGGLNGQQLQGDAIVAQWMRPLGVETKIIGGGLVLEKKPMEGQLFSFDVSNTPDLFPALIAICAGLQVNARFTGIASLGVKESDRVEAMKTELGKMGAAVERVSDNEVVLRPPLHLPWFESSAPLCLESHGDHRIVMALAPLSLKIGSLRFDRKEVVEKSYPGFWADASFLPIE